MDMHDIHRFLCRYEGYNNDKITSIFCEQQSPYEWKFMSLTKCNNNGNPNAIEWKNLGTGSWMLNVNMVCNLRISMNFLQPSNANGIYFWIDKMEGNSASDIQNMVIQNQGYPLTNIG